MSKMTMYVYDGKEGKMVRLEQEAFIKRLYKDNKKKGLAVWEECKDSLESNPYKYEGAIYNFKKNDAKKALYLYGEKMNEKLANQLMMNVIWKTKENQGETVGSPVKCEKYRNEITKVTNDIQKKYGSILNDLTKKIQKKTEGQDLVLINANTNGLKMLYENRFNAAYDKATPFSDAKNIAAIGFGIQQATFVILDNVLNLKQYIWQETNIYSRLLTVKDFLEKIKGKENEYKILLWLYNLLLEISDNIKTNIKQMEQRINSKK